MVTWFHLKENIKLAIVYEKNVYLYRIQTIPKTDTKYKNYTKTFTLPINYSILLHSLPITIRSKEGSKYKETAERTCSLSRRNGDGAKIRDYFPIPNHVEELLCLIKVALDISVLYNMDLLLPS